MQEMEEEGEERDKNGKGVGGVGVVLVLGVGVCARNMAGRNWEISDSQIQITFHLKGNPAC